MDSSTSSMSSVSTVVSDSSIVGSWGDVDFSDDEEEDTLGSSLRYSSDVFYDSVERGGGTFTRSSIGIRAADVPTIESVAAAAGQEDAADLDVDAMWQYRFSTDSNLSHDAMDAMTETGEGAARSRRTRRVSSIYNIACRWNIEMEDAIEIAAAFENAQTTC